jgi:hypothetical protein
LNFGQNIWDKGAVLLGNLGELHGNVLGTFLKKIPCLPPSYPPKKIVMLKLFIIAFALG